MGCASSCSEFRKLLRVSLARAMSLDTCSRHAPGGRGRDRERGCLAKARRRFGDSEPWGAHVGTGARERFGCGTSSTAPLGLDRGLDSKRCYRNAIAEGESDDFDLGDGPA